MTMSWIPRIGDDFGAYQLEEMIGHGGMSIVFRARHLALDRLVALKLLAPDLSDDPTFQERFVRESRLAAALDHPNVIPIYEAGEESGVYYIAMRYVPGSNLKALLRRDGPLDPAQTVSVIGQIASALSAAHDLGLVHRDVKPANVLIVEGAGADGSPHVYLSDFGIAKQQASNMTRTGMFLGTAEYASPEQIEGKDLDARSDIYSLGCVLYECLTGNPAYEKDSEVALIYAHLLEPPPSARAVRPELGPEIDAVLAHAMAKKPDDRYSSTKEMAAAVREALTPSQAPSQAEPVQAAAAAPPPAPETVLAATPPTRDPPAPADAASAAPPPPPPPPSSAEAAAPPAKSKAAADPARSARRRRVTIGVAVAVLVIGAAILAVALFTGGGSSANNAASTKPVSLLDALMPTGIASQCATQQAPSYGAVQTELCHPPANAPTSFPQTFSFSFFRSKASLLRAYTSLEDGLVIGNCGDTKGSKVWIHHSTGKTGGVRVCGSSAAGNSMVVWTHEKLASPDHVDMLGVAEASGRGANIYRGWWTAVKDDVGKCRPLIGEDTCFATVKHFENSG